MACGHTKNVPYRKFMNLDKNAWELDIPYDMPLALDKFIIFKTKKTVKVWEVSPFFWKYHTTFGCVDMVHPCYKVQALVRSGISLDNRQDSMRNL